jgi:hypothetical protein
MATTADWATRILTVYQADLTPLGGTSYQLDTEAFKIELRTLEASEAGEVHPPIVNHSTSVTLDGIDYARILEIINGYTLTFEETGTPYKVFLKGSNNNILTVSNLGTVQIAPNNSAGLINVTEIQHGVFNGVVTLDAVNGSAGQIYPKGAPTDPVNNAIDAVAIAKSRGFDTIEVIGDYTFDTGDNINGFTIEGQNAVKSMITINAGADAKKVELFECHVTGTLDGSSTARNCLITDLYYINGFIYNSVLSPGVISLGGGNPGYFIECVSGIGVPTIDMGGSGQALAVRGFNGVLRLINKTGSDAVSIDLASGQIILDSATFTGGSVLVDGDGKLVDENGVNILTGMWNGGVTIINETTSILQQHALDSISNAVWNHTQ